eukprot:SAG31_NODE_20661_length_568_cov_1.187633_1_plen_111_part_10
MALYGMVLDLQNTSLSKPAGQNKFWRAIPPRDHIFGQRIAVTFGANVSLDASKSEVTNLQVAVLIHLCSRIRPAHRHAKTQLRSAWTAACYIVAAVRPQSHKNAQRERERE